MQHNTKPQFRVRGCE